jgi:hypothetical protein
MQIFIDVKARGVYLPLDFTEIHLEYFKHFIMERAYSVAILLNVYNYIGPLNIKMIIEPSL